MHYDDESTYVSVQELLLYEMENNDEESLEHTSCIEVSLACDQPVIFGEESCRDDDSKDEYSIRDLRAEVEPVAKPNTEEKGSDLCRVERNPSTNYKERYVGEYGGYRKDILTENLSEREKVWFICNVCEGIMKEACVSESSEEQFCSCCQHILDWYSKVNSSVPVRKMINTLKCCCPLIERGCKWLGTLKDCEDHLFTCGYVYVSCKLKCGVVLSRNELEKHANECSHRQVKCEHCKKNFKSCELNEHLNKCAKMKVPCDLCDTQITREDMPQHLKYDCAMVLETCQLRCGVKRTRNELKIHEKDTCVQRKIACKHCYISLKFCDYSRHLKECPKMKVPCDLCDTQITREDIPQHLKYDCAMVLETCQLRCGVKRTRNELKIHVKDTCVQRKIACKHCNISVKFCDYSKHLRECPYMEVPCEICSEEKYRKDMTEHLKFYCPEKMIECLFVKYKCTTVIKRKDLANHLEEKETKHLGLKLTAMEDLISKQSEEISKQSEEITKQREENSKQSVEFENKHCIASKEFEKEKRSIELLYSITNVTSHVWNIGNVTHWKVNRRLASKQYQAAGYSFSFRLYSRQLSIVFPETAIKYDNPFMAKCHIVLSSSDIMNCGKIEVEQKDLTRGCERVIANISFIDIDSSNLTLEIYLTM